MEAYQIAKREHLIPPLMEQPEYNMLHREKIEKEYMHLYSEIGLGTTIWSPLKSGILTGKYNSGTPDNTRLSLPGYEWLKAALFSDEGKKNILKVVELTKLAKELGISMAQLALAWTLANKNVSTVITGASSPNQLKENMKVLEFVSLLTEDVVEKIEKILDNKPTPPNDFKG